MKKHIATIVIIILILIAIYNNLLFISPKIAIMLGQDINKTDINGNTALTLSIQKDNTNLVKKLIKLGADVNIADNDKNTPLIFAIKEKSLDITKELIKAEADLNAKNKEGKTALILAIEKRSTDIIKELINAGADVNIADNYGFTPFMLACDTGDLSMVNLLIEAGVNDKSAPIIKNIREFIDKKQFLSAAKILNKNSNTISNYFEVLLLSRIIDNSLENKKFATARKIVKESNISKQEKTNFISKIDSSEITHIKQEINSLFQEKKISAARKVVRNSSLSQDTKDELLADINHSYLKYIFEIMLTIGNIYGSFMDRTNCMSIRKLEDISPYDFTPQMYKTQQYINPNMFIMEHLGVKYWLDFNGATAGGTSYYPLFYYIFDTGEVFCSETSKTLECPQIYDYDLHNSKYFSNGGYGRTYKYRVNAPKHKKCSYYYF